jgi:lysozyme
MQTSEKGIAFIERHEGVILKAYRDPVGIWTIGPGLTAASGVIKPAAGMVLSRERARELLSEALAANYEPGVMAAMPGARQHAFDGGVSFHFNTGAIGRASWVRKWRAHDLPGARAAIRLWNKAGGKVFPGLERRREEEYLLIAEGIYAANPPPAARGALAGFANMVDAIEEARIRDGLASLGYGARSTDLLPGSTGILREGVEAFQRDYDLTVDGVIGKATLSTLQRALDARSKTVAATTATGAGGGVAATDVVADPTALPPWLGWAVLALGALWLAWLAFTYRDALAARVQRTMPRLAAFLRSF